MNLQYQTTKNGLRLGRCYGLDGKLWLPETVEGEPLTEIDKYTFSAVVRGREAPPEEMEGEPALCGEAVEELALPQTIKKVGAYAFYNCGHLRKLTLCSTLLDWGAGAFTGCTGLKELDIRLDDGKKSCFQEVLLELNQTLEATVRDWDGSIRARLIFPEFFEESVENTPARIIMREMHGCGYRYRYCFADTHFSYEKYDSLFLHVQVQEKPELVTKLALYRLYWSWKLSRTAEEAYWDYVISHAKEAALGLIRREEPELLNWLAGSDQVGEQALAQMLEAAAQTEDAQAAALLLDAQHSRFGNGHTKTRTFTL